MRKLEARNDFIRALSRMGMTGPEIAEDFGLTRQMISVIVNAKPPIPWAEAVKNYLIETYGGNPWEKKDGNKR